MANIIGIDLGTTYSAVAKINDSGKAEIVKDAQGENITPSVVEFTGKEKYISFSCYIYDDKIEYRVDALENNYNNYIFKINNQQ